jgi:formylglycine-generating enzyme required for sulfatase activity
MSIRSKTFILAAATSVIAVVVAISYKAAIPGANLDVTTPACNNLPVTGSPYPGMVFVPGATFTMGAEDTYFEEGPAHEETVTGFWMDRHEVTNAQFAEFVAATGYTTLAERGIEDPASGAAIPGSAVFAPHVGDAPVNPFASWWIFMNEANWRQPEGPDSNLSGRDNHPVVHIAFEDAQAYAGWKGRSLPTEAQFELAAQSSLYRDAGGNFVANTWQGLFPFQHDPVDGYTGTAPVGCYDANDLGIVDLIGNVWEWTQTTYYTTHAFPDPQGFPEGYDPNQPGEPVAVIKGGSYLCAPNYCMRYRPEARQAQSKGLGTSHIGFRTVINP